MMSSAYILLITINIYIKLSFKGLCWIFSIVTSQPTLITAILLLLRIIRDFSMSATCILAYSIFPLATFCFSKPILLTYF